MKKNKSWTENRTFGAACLLVCLLPLTLEAATGFREEEIHSANLTGAPYLAVSKDATGNSALQKEGLYVRVSDKKDRGQWRPALLGHITSTSTGPLLDELSVTKISKRFESIALVENKITIFSMLSSSTDKNSYVQLGTENYLIDDLLSHRKISLPKIVSPDDIEIYQHEVSVNQNFQAILISVKDRQSIIPNSGLTFAFLLKVANGSEAMEFLRSPVLLDYEFHESKDLRKFLRQSRKGVEGFYSNNMLRDITIQSLEDPAPIREWKEKVVAAIDDSSTEISKMSFDAVPYIDVESGQLTYPKEEIVISLVDKSGNQQFSFEQIYRFGGQDYVRFTSGQGKIEKVPGRIDTDSSGAFKIFKSSESSEIVFILNGDLYYSRTDSEYMPVKLMSETFSDATSLGFSASASKKGVAIAVSRQIEGTAGETYIFTLNASNSQQFYINYVFQLKTDLFYSSKELSRRLIVEESDLFFDYLTGLQENSKAYEQSYRATLPHYKIGSTGVSRAMIRPTRETAISKNLVYREYEQVEGVDVQMMGLHVLDKNEKSTTVIEGELLSQPGSENKFNWVNHVVTVGSDKKAVDINLQVNLIDRSFSHGVDRVSFLLSAERNGSITTERRPQDFKLDEIRELRVVSDVNGDGGFYLFTVIRNEEGGESLSYLPGTLTTAVSNKGEKYTYLGLSDMDPNILQDVGEYNEADITDRIVYDSDGLTYWVNTVNLPIDDEKYSLTLLNSGVGVFPNSESDYGTKTFLSYEKAQKKSGNKRPAKGAESSAWLIKPSRVAASGTFKKLQGDQNSMVRTDIFPQLIDYLDAAARDSDSTEHKVLVVPDDIKPYVENIILNHWLKSDGYKGGFSLRNSNLDFYVFGDTASDGQEHLMAQLRVPDRLKKKSKTFMYVNAKSIIGLQRPKPIKTPQEDFYWIEEDAVDGESSSNIFESTSNEKVFPHALFLVANEGRAVGASQFLNNGSEATYTQLIVASNSEWDKLKEDARLEFSYGLDKHFNIEKLGPPGIDEQMSLFRELFDGREIRRRGYEFDSGVNNAKELSLEENKERLTKYIVMRVQTLSNDQKMNPLITFSDVLMRIRSALYYDDVVRQTRVVNRGLVERSLAKVFTVPLKLKYLAEDDFLTQLSAPDILTRIQVEGKYPGPFAVTKKIVDTILSQTKQESALRIPATIVLDGNSGTGKTELAMSLIRTLKLKTYDISKDPMSADNIRSQAFVLHVPNLTTSSKAAGLMNVDEALKHLDHFLSLPYGHRGFIVLDDLHLCSDEVRSKVISRLRTLIDSDDGMVHLKSAFKTEAQYESFPVRNLTIMMTYNPAERDDAAKEDTISTSKSKEERGMKALGGTDVQVDRSFFRRIGLYMIMDEFSVASKGPGLIEKFVTQTRDFYHDGYFVTMTKEVVEDIVKRFSKRDARNFFSNSVNGLGELVSDTTSGGSNSSVRIIVSRRLSDVDGEEIDSFSDGSMRNYIENNMIALNVSRSNPESVIELVNLVANSYRTQIYEGFVKSILSNVRFSGNDLATSTIQPAVMRGLNDHLANRSSLTPYAMNLDPAKLGIRNEIAVTDFNKDIMSMSERSLAGEDGVVVKELKYFPDIFKASASSVSLFDNVVSGVHAAPEQRTRSDVNSEYLNKVRTVLKSYLSKKLMIDDVEIDMNVDPEKWFSAVLELQQNNESLSDSAALMEVGKSISNLFSQYIMELEADGLEEKRSGSRAEGMNFYDKTRMFAYVVDKAISELPWIGTSKFLTDILKEAVNDEIGGSSIAQEFMFSSDSLLQPRTLDQTLQILANAIERQSVSTDTAIANRKRFTSTCERMLEGRGGDK